MPTPIWSDEGWVARDHQQQWRLGPATGAQDDEEQKVVPHEVARVRLPLQ